MTFTVDESKPTVGQYSVTNLNSDQMRSFTRDGELTPDIENALRDILVRKEGIAKLDAELQFKQTELDEIFRDQDRLRANMKVLKGMPEEKVLTARYTGELTDQETRLRDLRAEIVLLEGKKSEAQRFLNLSIQTLTFDSDL